MGKGKRMNKIYEYDEIARNNRVGMQFHWMMDLIMITLSTLEFLTSPKSPIVLVAIYVTGLTPVILESVFWRRDRHTPMIKHLIAQGFAIFYSVCIFTSTNNTSYLFVIPMILVISIYNDVKYALLINTGTIIEAIILAIGQIGFGKFGYTDVNSSTCMVIIMVLVGILSVNVAKVTNRNFMQKLEQLQEVAAKTEAGIQQVSINLAKLSESAQHTKTAMLEVTSGTTDTAKAVQNQVLQSDDIQAQITIVNQATATMTEGLKQTLSCIAQGNDDMNELLRQVDSSVETSTNAVVSLNLLEKSMLEMQSITKLIDDIAFQTNILALNANVEAARAGEAGRGFSVVATQVSEMSQRTTRATDQITLMIDNVTQSINDVVNIMQTMIHGINQEKESTVQTTKSFRTIQETSLSIQQNVSNLVDNIASLTHANNAIVASIQTISAASEQVSALANEAMSAEENNSEIIDNISEQMQELLAVTQK